MRDEEPPTTLDPPPDWFARTLADLPTCADVWAEAPDTQARDYYAARRFEGLYQQVLGLLKAATQEGDDVTSDPVTSMFDFWEQQRAWSYATFGPPTFKGPKGPLDHLKKEAAEAYDESDPVRQREEIADCLFLVFDAAHRAGMSYADLVEVAARKLTKNRARTWPDWRGTDPDKAIEHDRTGENGT